MIRTWGFQTIAVTGTAQPFFGDKITAAFSNIQQPNGFYFVTVANGARYQIGDRIILGYGSAGQNCLLVGGVNSNVLSCVSEGNSPVSNWAINSRIALDIGCFGLIVTLLSGATGSLWIGADSTVSFSGANPAGSAFFEVGKVTAGTPQIPFVWMGNSPTGSNPLRTTEGWVAGNNPDLFSVAALIA
jgi:hypothetical protein